MNDLRKEIMESGVLSGDSEAFVELFLEYTEAYDNEKPEMALEAILRKKNPGSIEAEFICVKPHNLIVNWSALVTEGIPTLVGAGAAFVANPYLGYVASLGALAVLSDNATVKFGEIEGKVVEALWVTHKETNPVSMADLHEALAGTEADDRLQDILGVFKKLRIIEVEDETNILKRDRLISRS